MKPSICELCHNPFDPDSGELLEFAKTASDAEWHRRAAAEALVGHPPNVAWFCPDHAERARTLTDQTLDDALAALRE